MKYRDLLGKKVSVLALGTSDFGGACPASLAMELMDAYCELGGNFIDTARVYGDFATPRNGESEKVIGRWMSARRNRSKLFISTKGAHPSMRSMHTGRLSRGEVRGDILDSLDALNIEMADIFWLHRDDESRPVGEIMETLQSLIDDGYTRMTGVSNWKPERIREANAYAASHRLKPIAANQPQFSLARQMIVEDDTLVQMNAELYQLHAETGMICAAFSSQAKGFYAKYDALGEAGLSDKARRRFLSEENLAIYSRMKQVQEETGLSIGAIALAWLTSQPFPVYPIVGASRVEQLELLREAGDAALTAQQRDFLRTL